MSTTVLSPTQKLQNFKTATTVEELQTLFGNQSSALNFACILKTKTGFHIVVYNETDARRIAAAMGIDGNATAIKDSQNPPAETLVKRASAPFDTTTQDYVAKVDVYKLRHHEAGATSSSGPQNIHTVKVTPVFYSIGFTSDSCKTTPELIQSAFSHSKIAILQSDSQERDRELLARFCAESRIASR